MLVPWDGPMGGKIESGSRKLGITPPRISLKVQSVAKVKGSRVSSKQMFLRVFILLFFC